MRGFRRMPAQTGKQGLFRLVKQAQESYTAEVATRQKSYRRYVLDFIHSKRYHDETDAWSKNEHLKNYHTIVDLLRGHEKLVRKYFEQEVFDDMQISGLLNEFYTFDLSQTDAPGDILERASAPRTKTPDIVFKPALGREKLTSLCNLPMRLIYSRKDWMRTTWPPATKRTRCSLSRRETIPGWFCRSTNWPHTA